MIIMKKKISFAVSLISFFALANGTELDYLDGRDCNITFINCTNEGAYPTLKMYISVENILEEAVNNTLAMLKNKKETFPSLQCDVESCDEKLKESFESIFQSDKQRENSTLNDIPSKTGNALVDELTPFSNNYVADWIQIPEESLLALKEKVNSFDDSKIETKEAVKDDKTKNSRSKRQSTPRRHFKYCNVKNINNSHVGCARHAESAKCVQTCSYGHGLAHHLKKNKAKFTCVKNHWKPAPLHDCKPLFSCDVRIKKGTTGELHCKQSGFREPIYCMIRCHGMHKWNKIKCDKHMPKKLKSKKLRCAYIKHDAFPELGGSEESAEQVSDESEEDESYESEEDEFDEREEDESVESEEEESDE